MKTEFFKRKRNQKAWCKTPKSIAVPGIFRKESDFITFRLILLKEQSHEKTFAKVYKLKSVTLLKMLMNDPHHVSRESYDSID
jgi:hypothetical protein